MPRGRLSPRELLSMLPLEERLEECMRLSILCKERDADSGYMDPEYFMQIQMYDE